jgi:hypothetical protein
MNMVSHAEVYKGPWPDDSQGQRYLELESAYSHNQDTGVTTVTVAQMPPNPNLFQPGPALVFYVVDGIPSLGEVSNDRIVQQGTPWHFQIVMIGTGAIGTQPTSAATVLPNNEVIVPSATASESDTASASDSSTASGEAGTSATADSATNASPSTKSAAFKSTSFSLSSALVAVAAFIVLAA